MIVNALYPARFDDGQAGRSGRLCSGVLPARPRGPGAALSEHARAAAQREQQARLADGLRLPLTPLPYVFADSFGPAELELLADALAAGLS